MSLLKLAAKRGFTMMVLTAATVLSGLPIVSEVFHISNLKDPLLIGAYLTFHAGALRFLQVLGEGLARGESATRGR